MTAHAQKRLRLVTLHPVVNHRVSFRVTKVPPCAFFFFLYQHMQKRVKNARFSRDKMQLQCLDQQEQFSQEDYTRDKIRHRVRQMLSDSPTEENRVLVMKGKRVICEPQPAVCFVLATFTFVMIFQLVFLFLRLPWLHDLKCQFNFSECRSTSEWQHPKLHQSRPSLR